MSKVFKKAKPFLGVILVQIGSAGMDVLSKAAFNQGMNNYVFVVYSHAIATLVYVPFAFIFDKEIRPKMTLTIFTKLVLLGLLGPVIDYNLYYIGMKNTTATFAAAMYNVLPAITFLMAYILRIEKIKFTSIRSQAKIGGTLITLAGAMLMTLVKGPVIELLWNKGRNNHDTKTSGGVDLHSSIKGALMITIGCFSYACFVILQTITLKTYPAELTVTAWICLLGTIEGAVIALIIERGKLAIWSISLDTRFYATLYSGIACSGLTYYIGGLIMKERGPVFVTAFSPLAMIIVAIIGSIFLAEQMFLGRVIGAILIVAGLYMVVWGKSKDYKIESQSIIECREEMKDQSNEITSS